MNFVALVGRLTKDPETRTTSGDTQVARFSIAVNRPYKNENGDIDVDFFNCAAFGKKAEFILSNFKKGKPIGIMGRIQTGKYTDKNGNEAKSFDIIVNDAEFVGNKSDNEDAGERPKKKRSYDDDDYETPKKKRRPVDDDDDEEYERPKKKRRSDPDNEDESDYPF